MLDKLLREAREEQHGDALLPSVGPSPSERGESDGSRQPDTPQGMVLPANYLQLPAGAILDPCRPLVVSATSTLGQFVNRIARHPVSGDSDAAGEYAAMSANLLGSSRGTGISASFDDEATLYGKSRKWVQQSKARLAAVRELVERERQIGLQVPHL